MHSVLVSKLLDGQGVQINSIGVLAAALWTLGALLLTTVASEAGAGRGRCEATVGSWRGVEVVLQIQRGLEQDVVAYRIDRVGFVSTEERRDLGISYLSLSRLSFLSTKRHRLLLLALLMLVTG